MRTFWEILLFQMHYTAKLLPPAIFEKFKIFFRKTHIFPKQLKLFDVFEKSDKSSCILQSCILQQTCHHQWILKNSNFFQDNHFFWKKPNFWTFWEISPFHSHSISNWLSSTCFRKLKFLFQKNHLFFWITQILNFLRVILYQLHSTSKLLPSAFFEKFKVFSEDPYFFAKKPIFHSFEKPYWFISLRHQVG